MRSKAKTLIEICALAGALVISLTQTYNASEGNDFPTTGDAPPRELRWLDEHARSLIKRWDIPGASVAVVKDGKIIFDRGYGYGDVEGDQLVFPNKSLFRIASVSKPITAAAILKLVEQGKLNLDDKAFQLLDVDPPSGTRPDKRLFNITVRDLLNMTAGWDKERSGDPILQPYIKRAARRMHMNGPADFDATMRYVLTKRLDFSPGSKFAYSNFAYGVLGKLVEKCSGQDYETYVRENILQPCGVDLYRGHTLEEDCLADEVTYYAPFEAQVRPFLPCKKHHVPAPYARAYMEADLPILGWVGTAPQLATLFDRLFTDEKLLASTTKEQIFKRPDVWKDKHKFFSMGWEVKDEGGGRLSLYKDGTLPGTRAFVEHTADGITWVALFNARPPQKKPDKFAEQVKELMSQGLDLAFFCSERRQARMLPSDSQSTNVLYQSPF